MTDQTLKTWQSLIPSLSEAQKRWYVAQKAIELGRGGITQMHDLTGLSQTTIIKAIKEIKQGKPLKMDDRVRIRGGGRKCIESENFGVVKALRKILNENTAGDPMSPLKWTRKTCRTIAEELEEKKIDVSYRTVCRLLHEEGYTLQANKKDKEGKGHPSRDEQFKNINARVIDFMKRGSPVISVDSKKREQVGNFKNAGKSWKKKGQAERVNAYDFPSLADGTAVLYGAYDTIRNEGLVNVGVSYDTSEYAVESIRQWWKLLGKKYYSESKELLICADGGGSNGSRNRGWKYNLQNFSDQTNLTITVCHYPPGTSKWNKIEHRMFSFISMNWKGKPLTSYETVVNLISSTTTKKGLLVRAKLDKTTYKRGIKISDDKMEELEIMRHERFPGWNYTFIPRK
jgi:transposase